MPTIKSNCRKCGAEIEVKVPSTFTGGPDDVHRECGPCERQWEAEFHAEQGTVPKEEPEVIYRPAHPLNPVGIPLGPDYRETSYYVVTQEDRVLAAYFIAYYRSVGEVVADLLSRIGDDEPLGPYGNDVAIWYSSRLVATIHESMDDSGMRVTRFNEKRNDPKGPPCPFPGWPSYEQWVEDGRDKIIIRPGREEEGDGGREGQG